MFVQVEHAVRGAKICLIVNDYFRCHKFGFNALVMGLACLLIEFKSTVTK